MYVIGLSRALVLPRLSSGATHGIVYRDLNGNGRRDHGEPGLDGVALRRGTDMAVTDRRGTYWLAGKSREPLEVDPRSLPLGWITAATRVTAGAGDIGVLAVLPVHVTLALEGEDGARVPRSELALLSVTARGSAGRDWVARRTSDSTAVFDALPPGRYTVDLDASEVREPLRSAAGPVVVIVAHDRRPEPVRIGVRARRLRYSPPRSGQR